MAEKDTSMRFIKRSSPLLETKTKYSSVFRQWMEKTSLLLVGSLLLLSACETSEVETVGVLDSVTGPLGGVASDEPRATLVAQDILSSGGTAADAATALYFTLSVTYPIAASIGGGGECIVYDREKNKLENLKFPVWSPPGGGKIAIPGNVRGFAALHARYGKMEWSALLSRAEQIANFGESMSRAQHMGMVTSSANVIFDNNLKNLYQLKDGTFKNEGTKIQQIRLASILTSLRSNGGASFYGGNIARSFVDDANTVGGKITTGDLYAYKPSWQDALSFQVDNNTVGVSTSEYGKLYRDYWLKLFSGKGLLHIDTDLPVVKVVDATATSFQKFTDHSPFVTKARTSFVVTDNNGGAVACSVGLKKPFGTGSAGNITGIVFTPNIPEIKSEFQTTPVLMVNIPTKRMFYASASTGGAAGTYGSVYTALQVFAEGKSLEGALFNPRLFTMGAGYPLLHEKDVPAADLQSVSAHHPVMIEVDRLGVVNAVHCLNGVLDNCQSVSDPRGYGLSLIQQ